MRLRGTVEGPCSNRLTSCAHLLGACASTLSQYTIRRALTYMVNTSFISNSEINYRKTSVNLPTLMLTLNGSFGEVVGLES